MTRIRVIGSCVVQNFLKWKINKRLYFVLALAFVFLTQHLAELRTISTTVGIGEIIVPIGLDESLADALRVFL